MERAAAWLRERGWGKVRPAVQAPPAEAPVVLAASSALPDAPDEEIDVAGWPALVAPFYD
jgi:hypothetical protein